MDAYQIPESIEWHEGLLLTPQHFQQLALRQESLLQYVSVAASPYLRGVRHLRHEPTALASGLFRVLEVVAVMPDGLVVSRGNGRGDPLEVDLKSPDSDKDLHAGALTIYLAVPARGADGTENGLKRFESVVGEAVADETTGEGEVRIPRRRPRLRLLAASEPPKNYAALPLARVRRNGDSYEMVDDYEPPRLVVERKKPLGAMCSDLVLSMRRNAVYLEDRLRGSSDEAREAALALFGSIVAPLSLLEAVLATDASHPYHVYLTLCTVAGHVSVMGRGSVPPKFPPYDHDDPLRSFSQVIEYIDGKLNQGVTPAYAEYTFTYSGGFYSLKFERDWADRRLVLGLRPQPWMTEQELVRWGRECIIASSTNMQLMREVRILGARRELTEADNELVAPRGVVLFTLKPDDDFVDPNEDLQIFNATERGQRVRPAEIVLYVKNAK